MLFKFDRDKEESLSKKPLKVYSPDEVIKAGGADKFARKIGHVPLTKRDDVPTIEFTDEEWQQVEKSLKNDK